MTFGPTDLVILENAAFPRRESLESLGRRVGDRKGVAVQTKCKQEHKAEHRSLSDLAEAAAMVEKYMSPS